jgi:anti-sigma B factor antagonist
MADFAGAQLFIYARSLGTVLRVDGEIDASNADDVAEAIRRFARLKTPLILDLSRLRFISVEGFRAVLLLNHECQKARVHCSVVTGGAMAPLMRIITDHGLPAVGSVPEALQLIEDIVRARVQLLSEMVRHRRPERHATRAAAVH